MLRSFSAEISHVLFETAEVSMIAMRIKSGKNARRGLQRVEAEQSAVTLIERLDGNCVE